jgi:hypothetical protein
VVSLAGTARPATWLWTRPVVRRTEWSPRASVTASAEPGLNFRHLGQLLGRELAFQCINRLHEVLRVAAPFNRILGKSPRMREGLVRLAVRGRAGGACPGCRLAAMAASRSRSARR